MKEQRMFCERVIMNGPADGIQKVDVLPYLAYSPFFLLSPYFSLIKYLSCHPEQLMNPVVAVAAVVVAIVVGGVGDAVAVQAAVVQAAGVVQVVEVLPLQVALPLVAALVVVLPFAEDLQVGVRHLQLANLQSDVLSLLHRMFKPSVSNVQDMGLLAEWSRYSPITLRASSTRASYIITTVRSSLPQKDVFDRSSICSATV